MESSVKRAIAAANQSRMAKRREQESESLWPSRTGPLELGLGLAPPPPPPLIAFFITELNRPCDLDLDLDLDLVANSKGVGGRWWDYWEGRRVGLLAWCGYKEFHHFLHPLFSTLQSPQAHLRFSARRFATKWDPFL
ncbi:hypothetical protein CMV_017035 [Castanea mollissima]|uniref:Uncharacterized protein n=1 Tax=Castanea mollissima TaxID=60419 RepID=A0A8J4QYL2_9ROSI|nr:hypothetical protein CMV_017035 [Castanea mollissima]